VRSDAPEVLPGATPAGLHLVGDEKDAALVEDLFVRREQPVRWDGEAADPLHRFGDHACDVARRRGVQQLAQVADAGGDVGGVVELAERAAEAVAALGVGHLQGRQAGRRPPAVAGDRGRREGPAVVAVAQRDDRVAASVGRREQQRGLVRLGPGAGEEHLRVRDAGQGRDALGQLDLCPQQVEGRGVHDPPTDLLLHRLAHLGRVVAEHVGQDAREEVEVGGAFAVGDPAARAGHQLERAVVVERQPRRHDGPVPVEQVLGAHAFPLPRRRAAS